jgi:hypothetical protein
MANRFPLIVNSNTNQIQELAAGDNLDLTSSGISSVSNIYSSGIVTATSFVGTLTGTASTASFATTSFGLSGSPSITVTGINASGVVTASSFVGSGANLTGIANTANIVSTAITTGILNVGTGITINASGVNVTGIVTASSFVGSGANLTNLNIPSSFVELDATLFG